MRNRFRPGALATALVLALTAFVPAGPAAGARPAAAPAAPAAAVAAVVTSPAPRTLYISVANRYLTMPHRIAAGKYYIQVRTSDARSSVQVVRPPAGYTPRQFLDARTHWGAVYNSNRPPLSAYTAFVRSVTFMGGAKVARGGVAVFGTGLTSGTYWLYEDTYDGPTHLSRIVVLTVVGTSPAQIQPPRGRRASLVRFSTTGGLALYPATLPTSGWLLGIGGTPLTTLTIARLRPGVTKADLDGYNVCFWHGAPDPIHNKDCFVRGAGLDFGGKLSAGASVFWYYRLPRGQYVAGNIAPTEIFDHPFYDAGRYARFTVS